jgi:hypothetical protein
VLIDLIELRGHHVVDCTLWVLKDIRNLPLLLLRNRNALKQFSDLTLKRFIRSAELSNLFRVTLDLLLFGMKGFMRDHLLALLLLSIRCSFSRGGFLLAFAGRFLSRLRYMLFGVGLFRRGFAATGQDVVQIVHSGFPFSVKGHIRPIYPAAARPLTMDFDTPVNRRRPVAAKHFSASPAYLDQRRGRAPPA